MQTSQCVGIYASILICRHICWHLDKKVSAYSSPLVECANIYVLTYMSASWCVSIYVGIWTCQHICQHRNKYVDIYVGIFSPTKRICRHLHLNMPNYMSAFGHINKFACTRTNVLTYMSAYFPLLEEYVGISMCWHICRHLDVSACMSASGHVKIFASIRTRVDRYVDIFITNSRMWQHLNVLG